MPTSEQDLEALHDGNEELRAQIAEARAAREQVTNQAETDARAAALKEEQARLRAELEGELAAAVEGQAAAEEIAVKADEPVETPYERMMREAEEANAAAQAEADAKAGKTKKSNGTQTPSTATGTPTTPTGNGGQ